MKGFGGVRMTFYTKQAKLTNVGIEMLVDDATKAYFSKVKKSAISETKFRLALEELLLQFRDNYGETDDSILKLFIGRKNARLLYPARVPDRTLLRQTPNWTTPMTF